MITVVTVTVVMAFV